jgi:hypothetical protein
VATTLLAAGAAQVLAVAVMRPHNAFAPRVLTRYLLPTVVVVLLFAAVGAATVVRFVARGSRLAGGVWLGLVAIVPLLVGPLPDLLPGPDSFASSRLYHRAHHRAQHLRQRMPDTPAFYREALRLLPAGRDLVLEAPYSGRQVVAYGFHQAVHRQPVVAGFTDGYCGAPSGGSLPTGGRQGLRFRSLLWLGDHAALRDAGVRWIVLHRQPEDETAWPERRFLGVFDFDACRQRLAADLGPPVRVDERLAVFDLGVVADALPSR